MGADIHIFAEIKKADKWLKSTDKIFGCGTDKDDAPFDWRSYGMFGFLADVRNYSEVPVIVEPKGLPTDSEWLKELYYDEPNSEWIAPHNGYHSHSWLSLRELIEFDYDKSFEDLRYTHTEVRPNGVTWTDGGCTAEPGKGTMTTYREFLGEGFFNDIEILKTLGDLDSVRVVFWFDN